MAGLAGEVSLATFLKQARRVNLLMALSMPPLVSVLLTSTNSGLRSRQQSAPPPTHHPSHTYTLTHNHWSTCPDHSPTPEDGQNEAEGGGAVGGAEQVGDEGEGWGDRGEG